MEPIQYEAFHNADPLFPFSFRRLTMQGGRQPANVFVNWHTDLELIYCLSGRGRVLCGSRLIPIAPGELVVINSELFHDVITQEHLECCALIVENSFCHQNGIRPEQLLFAEHLRDPQIRAAFEALMAAQEATEPFRVSRFRWAVLGLLLHLCTHHLQTDHYVRPVDPATQLVKNAIHCIRERFTEPFSLEELARVLNVSRYYLAHRFKSLTGRTVVEYRNLLRCLHARALIQNGSSVSDAAFSSGFENLSYFSRTYKKCMSLLPSEETPEP